MSCVLLIIIIMILSIINKQFMYLLTLLTHLMLCLATAPHNFKRMKITHYLFNIRRAQNDVCVITS